MVDHLCSRRQFLSAWTHSLYESGRSASPTAASFIRPSRPNDQPVGIFEALKKKYASSSAEDIVATANEIHISGKTVEEVGFEKIRRQLAELQELRIVVLDGACIATVESDLDEQHLKIVELDLSRNLIESWCEITAICKSLQFLRCLKLDGNTLSRPEDPFKNDEPHVLHERLQELSLNDLVFLQKPTKGKNGNLSWEFVRNFTAQFPSLTTLSLASNNLTDVTSPLTIPFLTKLDLSFNAFTTLENIHPLAALPNLQNLSLRANPLTSLSSSPDESIIFLKLKHLDLMSTLLPTLSSLNLIPISFPRLTSLLTKHTPLTTYPSASLHTIARLATLTELNYSQITPPERQNAELYYLSQVSKQLAAATNETEERKILDEHPRWKELCDIHGEPTITRTPATATASAGTLAARVTAFTFHMATQDLQKARKHAQSIAGHSADEKITANSDPEEPRTHQNHPPPPSPSPPPPNQIHPITEQKKLIPRTIDTYRLKGIVAHLFDIRPLSIRLVWETEEWDPVAEEEEGWSVSEEESEEERRVGRRAGRKVGGMVGGKVGGREGKEEEGRWKRREMELVDGTREVGFFVEGAEARVRVELR